MGGLGKELCWGAGPSSEACRDGEMKLLTVMGWGWVRQGCPVLEGVSCAEWGWEGVVGRGQPLNAPPAKSRGCLSKVLSLLPDATV